MGFQSQSGQVGLRTQAVKGTYLDPGTSTFGIFMRTKSGSLEANRDLLIPDPEIGGGRDVSDAYLGPVAFSGGYDFYARVNALALLLKGLLGPPVSTTVTDYEQHVFTPIDTGSLPWMSIEEAIGDGFDVFNYTDAKVESLHFEVDANGFLQGTVGFNALSQTAGNTKTAAPAWDLTPMMVGSNCLIKWNGANLPAKSLSFDMNNNSENDDYRLGSVFLGDITEKRREITVGATIRPTDSALYKTAVYGSAAASSAQAGAVFKDDVQILCTSYEVITGAATMKYTIQVDIPQAVIKPFGVSPSGDDIIQHDLSIQALRPNPATPAFTVTIKTDLAAIP